jgi:ParB family transcriptional regulator, chromosome partitioning protein
MERRLGRGLGSLLGSTGIETPPSPTQLPIEELRPNPHQPRRVFDAESLSELAESIRSHGILQPIVVRAVPGAYEIISGERRWRAARLAGMLTVPVVVRDHVPDEQMLELALIENVQRQELDAIERAEGYRQMMQQLHITQEEVAQKVGLKRATVANHIRLLELPEKIRNAVGRGLLSMGHARALLAHPVPAQLPTLLERIVRDGLSVRQIETLVRTAGREAVAAGAKKEVRRVSWLDEIESRLRESLGRRASVKNAKGYRGQIVLEYYDRDDLERLCNVLAPQEKLK